LRRSHARYFSNLAQEALEHTWKPDQAIWLNRLEGERDNLREVLRWSAVQDREQIFLQLAGNLWRFWSFRGPISEGRAWLDQAVEVCEANASHLENKLILRVIMGDSELARLQGDFEQALRLKHQLLEMCRQWGEERWVASILNDLAIMHADHGDCERSLALAEEAVSLRRKLGNPFGISHALAGLFFALMCFDEFQAAQQAVEEAIQIDRDGQNLEGLAWDLISLLFIAARQGRSEEIERIVEEVLPLLRELVDQSAIATGIYGMGGMAAAQGQGRQAARLLGVAEQIAVLGGFWIEVPGRAWVERTIQAAKADIGEAAWEQEYQAGQALAASGAPTMEQAIAFALEKNDA
jgi:non-specific serine/threonine protein kinase